MMLTNLELRADWWASLPLERLVALACLGSYGQRAVAQAELDRRFPPLRPKMRNREWFILGWPSGKLPVGNGREAGRVIKPALSEGQPSLIR